MYKRQREELQPVADGAYLDRDFNTIDVCVVMDTTRMTERYLHFYQRTRGRRG